LNVALHNTYGLSAEPLVISTKHYKYSWRRTHQEMRQRTLTFLRRYRTRTSKYQKENPLRLTN